VQTADGYQVALDLYYEGSGRVELLRDARYGAPTLKATWKSGGPTQAIRVAQTVITRDRGSTPLVPITAAERSFWTQASESVPTDAIVRATADRITKHKTEQRERLRAIYDWVVDNTFRNPNTPGCGLGDVKSMLETGNFGGKCADINGLMVALARAAGFPARDVYGIRVAESRQLKSLGSSDNISKSQHCRAEVYLEDVGWFPVDPADVRKVVLEQKLALDSPEIRALRDRLFGTWEMNWVGYNSATDIELPGAAEGQTPNFPFLMYPCAFTMTGQADSLSPADFQYEITSREEVPEPVRGRL
jgi:transglutaminase-like putative cysteine protease